MSVSITTQTQFSQPLIPKGKDKKMKTTLAILKSGISSNLFGKQFSERIFVDNIASHLTGEDIKNFLLANKSHFQLLKSYQIFKKTFGNDGSSTEKFLLLGKKLIGKKAKEFLKKHSNSKVLDLTSLKKKLSPQKLEVILVANPEVQKVDISRCKLVNDESLALLARCTHLQILNLSGCEITDTNVKKIGDFKNLKCLYLVACRKITNKGYYKLLKVLLENQAFRTLDISYCSNIKSVVHSNSQTNLPDENFLPKVIYEKQDQATAQILNDFLFVNSSDNPVFDKQMIIKRKKLNDAQEKKDKLI